MASLNGVSFALIAFSGLTLLLGLATFTSAGVPLQRYEALMKRQTPEEMGLYNSSDQVTILTISNFNAVVLQQNHSVLVEFYNSYCGHCKRFAPKYKQLAAELHYWREVLVICAIDCAAEENNGICREYEVMAYPTLRYFGPGFAPSESNYGRSIDTQELAGIRTVLANYLIVENRTANSMNWPNLQNLSESDQPQSLFEGQDSQRQYIVVVYEPENTTIGIETALHFLEWPNIQIRRVTEADVASKFKIDGSQNKIAFVSRQGTISPYAVEQDSIETYIEAIQKILDEKHITEKPIVMATTTTATARDELGESKRHAAILMEVKQNKHLVYQADLEMAIRHILFNEIPKVGNISGERLLALQRFLSVLQRYNPLGVNGRRLVKSMNDLVVEHNSLISGKEFEKKITELEAELAPTFTAKYFVGCASSQPGLRGFTCSMWQLFHFLTVQAAQNDLSNDPLEVLQAMHGLVKYFFGCTDCAEHFQAMANRRKIWNTPSKDEAVLWLWGAHNEVNKRLAGDSTEDAEFPKIQFPSQASCSECYRSSTSSPGSSDISWDQTAVLNFLRNIYNPELISRYGIENEEQLNQTVEKIRQKRMIGNVFSDVDMRMGMLLYAFCIVMMVIAFKLFAFKGYRKKAYGHDLLGKV